MDLTKPYVKNRKDFGRQPLFCMTTAIMLDSIEPNPVEQKKYFLRNPVHRDAQACWPQSEHDVNTIRVHAQNRGMNHYEGGWPKEVNCNNEEETLRHRRRTEREDHYIRTVMTMAPKFEHYIKQNNAIEIYELYFKGMEETIASAKPTIKLKDFFKDPDNRPVASLCWTIEDDPKLVATYCSKKYPVLGPVNKNLTCFVWELHNSHIPASEFSPPAACWQVACLPTYPDIIIGGLEDGRVCIFDLRASKEPIAISPRHTAHRDPITGLIFLRTRQNNEFFTSSTDGQCMWYDFRNLTKPTDSLIMSINIAQGETATFSNSEGVSTLQFDRTLPTRFLCGTETGLVLSINRKGKTHQEIMSGVFRAQTGPVRAVHRSHCTAKMFLSCGDWRVNIWSEDIKSSPIITGMTHYYQLMDAVWSPGRISAYMTVSVDGKLRYWDLLRKFREPVVEIKISKYPLLKIVPQDEGNLVAMGDKIGTISLVSLSQDLVVSGEKDKALMMQTYERECLREHLLYNRVKEIRLKAKTEEEVSFKQDEEEYDDDALVKAAEEEYRKQVIDEIRRSGTPQTPLNQVMRKR